MNDAEFEVQKTRILERYRHWHHLLGLWNWEITHHFYMESIPDEPGDPIACTNVQWQYLHATISWNTHYTKDYDDAKLEKIVVHEQLHIFVHELRHQTDDWLLHEERVVTNLANALLWTRDSERISPEEVE